MSGIIQWNLSIEDTIAPSWLSCIQWNLSIEDTIGPSWLSCIQWDLSIEDTIETQLAVLYRAVSRIQR